MSISDYCAQISALGDSIMESLESRDLIPDGLGDTLKDELIESINWGILYALVEKGLLDDSSIEHVKDSVKDLLASYGII